MARITSQKRFRIHRPGLSLAMGKIGLDNSWATTYHTGACPKGLTVNARKVCVGSKVNRGVDFYDE